MNFNNFIEIDTASDSILLKRHKEGNNEIIVKLNDEEIEEIKVKQNSIEFFTSKEDFSNPLGAEFYIKIYLNNYVISYEVTGEEREDIIKFCEYVKSIII